MARNRNVYILGAGFSADAGVPVMATFLQTAREFYESPRTQVSPGTRKHYERVFQFRHEAKQSRDSLEIDLENVEELFGLIDMMSLSETGSSRRGAPSNSIKHLIAHTVNRFAPPVRNVLIRVRREDVASLPHRTLLDRFEKEMPGPYTLYELSQYQFVAALFAGLFDRREDTVSDAVVTFNYDTVLEQAMWSIGAQVDYRVKRITRVGEQVSANRNVVVPIAKMHGSSNWAYVGKRSLRAHVFDSYGDFFEIHDPIVVPPTWKKGELSPLLGEVWAQAYEYLSSATRICIIGYSMPPTDVFFHHLMAASLSKNPMIYGLFVVDREGSREGQESVNGRYTKRFGPLVKYGHYEFSEEGAMGFFHKGNLEKLERGSLIHTVGPAPSDKVY